jgi:hypothetical protein
VSNTFLHLCFCNSEQKKIIVLTARNVMIEQERNGSSAKGVVGRVATDLGVGVRRVTAALSEYDPMRLGLDAPHRELDAAHAMAAMSARQSRKHELSMRSYARKYGLCTRESPRSHTPKWSNCSAVA